MEERPGLVGGSIVRGSLFSQFSDLITKYPLWNDGAKWEKRECFFLDAFVLEMFTCELEHTHYSTTEISRKVSVTTHVIMVSSASSSTVHCGQDGAEGDANTLPLQCTMVRSGMEARPPPRPMYFTPAVQYVGNGLVILCALRRWYGNVGVDGIPFFRLGCYSVDGWRYDACLSLWRRTRMRFYESCLSSLRSA